MEKTRPRRSDDPARFDVVLANELAQIRARRTKKSIDNLSVESSPSVGVVAQRKQEDEALKMGLVGLAISGGGIRSATFGLGVLQGLADFNLLERFDYLSTVSGGGFIGSWLAAWIKREGDLHNVQQQLKPNRFDQAQARRIVIDRKGTTAELPVGQAHDEEPEPVYHLRAYSNYLAPRPGLLSADGWVLIAIYIRNLLLNQLILLPALIAVFLVSRFAVLFYSWPIDAVGDRILVILLLGSLIWAMVIIGWTLNHLCPRPVKDGFEVQRIQSEMHRFQWQIVLPIFLAAAIVCYFLEFETGDPLQWEWLEGLLPCNAADTTAWGSSWLPTNEVRKGIILFGMFFGGLNVVKSLVFQTRLTHPWRSLWAAVSAALSGMTGGAALYVVFAVLLKGQGNRPFDVAVICACGPPCAVLTFILAAMVEVGLLGLQMTDAVREWWASLCGWLLLYAVLWAVVLGVALFGGWLLLILIQCGGEWGPWISAALGSGWIGTAIGGTLAGRSPQTGSEKPNRLLECLALIAPYVFLAGFLALVSLSVGLFLAYLSTGNETESVFDHDCFWLALLRIDSLRLLACLAGCIALAALTAWRVGVNIFSLHGTYCNRLVRCYLGASRPKLSRYMDRTVATPTKSVGPPRQPNAITGFDPLDDMPLSCLRIGEQARNAVGSGQGLCPESPYWGPYPLINTALNLVQGDELAWQERKADAFVLTPIYCGSKSTGYRPLPEFAGGLNLGTAVTLSGAAASPNMGYHSSAAVTALLTIFNVRLGGWLGNPGHRRWRRPSPGQGLFFLVKELFGRTNARSDYVYLSDGGHFENLGVYELIRRRCRFIVVSDAGADPDFTFQDLANLIHKCRVDFGIRIEIDVEGLRRDRRLSRWHCAAGTIRYSDVTPNAPNGILVYLKPSLTGNEPPDVQYYAGKDPTFPHQTTANQFFKESQFESYRALGFHVVREVFQETIEKLAASPPGASFNEDLFENLRKRWFPPPPNLDQNFLESVKPYVNMREGLRTDPNLGAFSHELYPDLGPPPAPPATGVGNQARAELHAVAQMLQVMENAYLAMRLDEFHEHPINRGWMNVCRRWFRSPTFQKHWPILQMEFSSDFVSFCDRELRANPQADAQAQAKHPVRSHDDSHRAP